MTQARIFSFQETDTIDVASQAIIKILQLNFLSDATMARWAAIKQTIHQFKSITNIEMHKPLTESHV